MVTQQKVSEFSFADAKRVIDDFEREEELRNLGLLGYDGFHEFLRSADEGALIEPAANMVSCGLGNGRPLPIS